MKKKPLILLIIVALLSSTVFVSAGFVKISVLTDKNVHFSDATKELGEVASKSSYPLKEDTTQGPTFTQLGYDKLLGTKRRLVSYSGEVPNVFKNVEGFGRFPYSTYTGEDPEYWGSSDVCSVKQGKEAVVELEKFAGEGDKVTSLRLYALTKSSSGFNSMGKNFDLSTMLYNATKTVCHCASNLLTVLVTVKNVNLTKVLEALKLKELSEVFAKVFVRDNGNWSIFMILAIVSFIFVVAGFALNWVRGNGKGVGAFLKDVMVVFLIGLTLTFMSLSGSVSTLGTTLANAAGNLAAEIAIESVDGSGIWQNTASGIEKGDSTVTSYNETSIINKTLIDCQIMTQFGVDDISDLNASNLGGGSTIIDLKGDGLAGNECNLSNYGNNLGYYFWYANSPAPTVKGTGSKAVYEGFKSNPYQSSRVDYKLEGVITYLQTAYNSKQDDKILAMVDSLANPRTGSASVTYLLLTIEYVLLTICLFSLVWRIVFAKLMAAGGILGLAVAGPLIITGRKNLVQIGYSIALIIVTYSIQLFILSVLFDVFLIVLNTLIKPNIVSIFLVIALTIAFWVFIPKLVNELDKLFASINSAIGAKGLTNIQRRVKAEGNRVFGKVANSKLGTRTRTVTRNGVTTTETKRNILGMAAAAGVAATAVHRRGTNVETVGEKITSKKERKKARNAALAQQHKEKVEQQLKEASQEQSKRKQAIFGESGNSGQTVINAEGLTEDEKSRYERIMDERMALSLQSESPMKLKIDEKIKKEGYDALNENEKTFVKDYNEKIAKVRKENEELVKDIHARVDKEVAEEYELHRTLSDTQQGLSEELSRRKTRSKEASDTYTDIASTRANIDNGDFSMSTASERTHLEFRSATKTAGIEDKAKLTAMHSKDTGDKILKFGKSRVDKTKNAYDRLFGDEKDE